jgi:murein DD-endopeptidase MepM/ murein hydrolase activator NlpD
MKNKISLSPLLIAAIILIIAISIGLYWNFKEEYIPPTITINPTITQKRDTITKSKNLDSTKKQIRDTVNTALLRKILQLEAGFIARAKNYEDLRIVVNNMSTKSPNFEFIPGIIPLKPGTYRRISSHFGMRFHPIRKVNKMHFGMDVSAVIGTPVYATATGYVQIASYHQAGYGTMVKLKHQFGFQSIYGHLKTFTCKAGEFIKRGELIGYVGSTGLSTGPHLHYEIVKNNQRIDPIQFVEFAKKIFLNDYLKN